MSGYSEPAHVIQFTTTLTPLNANMRQHWAAKAALTKAWRKLGYAYARQQRIPRMERARVTVTVSFPDDTRRREVSNLHPTAKALCDGIFLDVGVLPDDSDRYLVGPDLRRGPRHDGRGTGWRIDIEPLDGDGHG